MYDSKYNVTKSIGLYFIHIQIITKYWM